jgi:hypothetical protein
MIRRDAGAPFPPFPDSNSYAPSGRSPPEKPEMRCRPPSFLSQYFVSSAARNGASTDVTIVDAAIRGVAVGSGESDERVNGQMDPGVFSRRPCAPARAKWKDGTH